jgi:hypothetical protein
MGYREGERMDLAGELGRTEILMERGKFGGLSLLGTLLPFMGPCTLLVGQGFLNEFFNIPFVVRFGRKVKEIGKFCVRWASLITSFLSSYLRVCGLVFHHFRNS